MEPNNNSDSTLTIKMLISACQIPSEKKNVIGCNIIIDDTPICFKRCKIETIANQTMIVFYIELDYPSAIQIHSKVNIDFLYYGIHKTVKQSCNLKQLQFFYSVINSIPNNSARMQFEAMKKFIKNQNHNFDKKQMIKRLLKDSVNHLSSANSKIDFDIDFDFVISIIHNAFSLKKY